MYWGMFLLYPDGSKCLIQKLVLWEYLFFTAGWKVEKGTGSGAHIRILCTWNVHTLWHWNEKLAMLIF